MSKEASVKVKRYNAYFEPDPRMMREEEFGSYVYATDYDSLLALARELRGELDFVCDLEGWYPTSTKKLLKKSAWLEE